MTAPAPVPSLSDDTRRPDRYRGMGERALWCAVVQQALDDLDYEPVNSLLHDDAAAFFLNGGEWAVSRGEVADMLDIHPDDIRRCGVRHMAERRRAEGIPEPVVAPCHAVTAAPAPMPRLEAVFLPAPKRRYTRHGPVWNTNTFRFDPWRQIGDAAD
jgi:hypothetical protein